MAADLNESGPVARFQFSLEPVLAPMPVTPRSRASDLSGLVPGRTGAVADRAAAAGSLNGHAA